MVNIDRVYQKVLALTNKEQRGYITPQEFTLLANQAQMEIFEQYFYDIEQLGRAPSNDSEFSDRVTNVEEKLSYFQHNDQSASISGGSVDFTSGTNLYKLGSVTVKYPSGIGFNRAERLTFDQFKLYETSPLTKGTLKKPYYTLASSSEVDEATPKLIGTFSPGITSGSEVKMSYTKSPANASWGYVVVQGKALYDPSKTSHFQLHKSEEVELVYKILKLAGVTIQKTDIVQVGQGLEAAKIQQEKQ